MNCRCLEIALRIFLKFSGRACWTLQNTEKGLSIVYSPSLIPITSITSSLLYDRFISLFLRRWHRDEIHAMQTAAVAATATKTRASWSPKTCSLKALSGPRWMNDLRFKYLSSFDIQSPANGLGSYPSSSVFDSATFPTSIYSTLYYRTFNSTDFLILNQRPRLPLVSRLRNQGRASTVLNCSPVCGIHDKWLSGSFCGFCPNWLGLTN